MDSITMTVDTTIYEIATPCLICGDSVPIEHYSKAPKICDKCKEAVLLIRNMMENPTKPILEGGIVEL